MLRPDLGQQRLGTGPVMAIVEAEVIPLPRQITGRRGPYASAAASDQHPFVHEPSWFPVLMTATDITPCS